MTTRRIFGGCRAALSALCCVPAFVCAADTAQIVWTKTISGESDRYCGWPTVCDIGGGEIAAVFSGDRNGHVCPWGKVRMVRSKDGGETWSASETVCSSVLDDRDAGLLRLKDGALVLFWFTSVHFYEHYHDDRGRWPRNPDYLRHFEKLGMDAVRRDLGSFSRRSTDGGRTWSAPVRLPTSAPHGGVQLPDGRLMVVGIQGSQVRGRMRADPEEKALSDAQGDRRFVVAAESVDGGCSWRECSRVPVRDGDVFEEPHLIAGEDGVLRCYARTRRDLAYSESRDGGRTWTEPAATGIPSWHNPPFLLRLKDGRTLLTYGRRVLAPKRDVGWKTGVYVRIGDRNATPASFEAAPELTLHVAENVDMGYASTVECADGSFVTVLYAHDRPDAEIVAVKWRLQ